MSTFFLINTTQVGNTKFFAGETIDDAVHPAAAIAAAGGVLWPSSDAVIAKKNRGANEATLNAIMAAAVDSLQKQSDQGGEITLVAGVATLSTGITVTALSRLFFNVKTPGGAAQGTRYKYTTVVGGPGVGSFTVTAVDSTGATVVTDVSVLAWGIDG